jgi:hypothetical protein
MWFAFAGDSARTTAPTRGARPTIAEDFGRGNGLQAARRRALAGVEGRGENLGRHARESRSTTLSAPVATVVGSRVSGLCEVSHRTLDG